MSPDAQLNSASMGNLPKLKDPKSTLTKEQIKLMKQIQKQQEMYKTMKIGGD